MALAGALRISDSICLAGTINSLAASCAEAERPAVTIRLITSNIFCMYASYFLMPCTASVTRKIEEIGLRQHRRDRRLRIGVQRVGNHSQFWIFFDQGFGCAYAASGQHVF